MANHPGHIEKRGRGYRIRIHYNGKMYRRTVQVRTKGEAEKAAHQMMTELMEHGFLKDRRKAPADPRSMERLFDHFEAVEVPEKAPRTRAAYRDSLKPLRAFFIEQEGNPDPRGVTSKMVKRFTRWRRHHGPDGQPRDEPLSNRTIQKDRAVLSAIFSCGVEEGLADANPVTKKTNLRTKKRDPEILTQEQYDALIHAAYAQGPMVGLFALVLGETGARCKSEALKLRWEDVDLQEGFVR
ncbi:MAG: tyrosine-type recombinase/integrase, partial [Phycisphaerales bacterium JB040]